MFQRFNRPIVSSVPRRAHHARYLSQLGITFNQRPQQQQPQSQLSHSSSFLFSSSTKIKDSFNNTLNKYTNRFKPSSSRANSVGLFGKSTLSHYDGFQILKEDAESNVSRLIQEVMSDDKQNKRKVVEIFDDISNELCCVADMAEFIRTSHPDIKYRQAANFTFEAISQLVEKLNTNFELYSKLRSSLSQDARMDECDQRVCRLFLLDFEQSGIHLDQKSRNNFVAINDQLVHVLMKFQINSQAPSQVGWNEIDPKFKQIAKIFKDPIQVDSMFIDSENDILREFVYKMYLKENKLQESYFGAILAKRRQLANLCGFATFSHRANQNTIMETPENIMSFLRECSDSIYSKAASDFELMRQFKKKTLRNDEPLMPWDIPLISGRLKKQMLDLDRSQYMSYFSLGSCMEGLNIILNHLYNVNLEVVKLEPGEAWHEDIYKLAVLDSSKGLLGYIYCDFYQRSEKFSNVDCHFTIQCSKQLQDGSFQTPIVVLHLNFPAPTPERPTLLTFEMMENLFHEFGHAMHSMFAKTRYQHVSGTRCSTDFAEVPSQLMEYYCREPSIIKLFAKHYISQKPIDDKMLHKLCDSKKMFSACELQSQLVNSMLDQAFHIEDLGSTNQRPVDLIKKYTEQYHSLPYVDGTNWHLRFTHLVGYGAKYYSYLVSKAIASNIWTECFERDPLSSTAGDKYRKRVLEFGGERRPQELINSLLQSDITQNQSLVKSLTQHL